MSVAIPYNGNGCLPIDIFADNGHNGAAIRPFLSNLFYALGDDNAARSIEDSPADDKHYNDTVSFGTNGQVYRVTWKRPRWDSMTSEKPSWWARTISVSRPKLVPYADFIVTGLNAAVENALDNDHVDISLHDSQTAVPGEGNDDYLIRQMKEYGLTITPLGFRPNRMVLAVRGDSYGLQTETFNDFRVYPIAPFMQELQESESELLVGSEYPGLARVYFTDRAGNFVVRDTKEATEGFLHINPDNSVILEIVEGGGQMVNHMQTTSDYTVLWPPVLKSSISLISHTNGADAEKKKGAREKTNMAFVSAHQRTFTQPAPDLLRERLGETAWKEMDDYINNFHAVGASI